jgi:hypothetical protein
MLTAIMHFNTGNPGIRKTGIFEIYFCKEQVTISYGLVLNFDVIDLELVVPQEGKLDRYVIYFSISTSNKIIAKTKMVIPSTNRLNTIKFTKGFCSHII